MLYQYPAKYVCVVTYNNKCKCAQCQKSENLKYELDLRAETTPPDADAVAANSYCSVFSNILFYG